MPRRPSLCRYPASGYVIDLPPQRYFKALADWEDELRRINETQGLNMTLDELEALPGAPPPPSKLEYAMSELLEAKAAKWLDKQTVYACLEFTVYNPAVRVMTGAKASFEFFPSGQVWRGRRGPGPSRPFRRVQNRHGTACLGDLCLVVAGAGGDPLPW